MEPSSYVIPSLNRTKKFGEELLLEKKESFKIFDLSKMEHFMHEAEKFRKIFFLHHFHPWRQFDPPKMLLFAILIIRDNKFLGLLIRAEKTKKDRFFLCKIGKSDKTIGKSDRKLRKIIIIFKILISKSAKFLPF